MVARTAPATRTDSRANATRITRDRGGTAILITKREYILLSQGGGRLLSRIFPDYILFTKREIHDRLTFDELKQTRAMLAKQRRSRLVRRYRKGQG